MAEHRLLDEHPPSDEGTNDPASFFQAHPDAWLSADGLWKLLSDEAWPGRGDIVESNLLFPIATVDSASLYVRSLPDQSPTPPPDDLSVAADQIANDQTSTSGAQDSLDEKVNGSEDAAELNAKLQADGRVTMVAVNPVGADGTGIGKHATTGVDSAAAIKGPGSNSVAAAMDKAAAGETGKTIVARTEPAAGPDQSGDSAASANWDRLSSEAAAGVDSGGAESGVDIAGEGSASAKAVENAGRGKGAGTTGDDDVAGTAKLPGDESAIIATAKPTIGSDAAGVMKPAAGDVESAGQAKGAGAIGFDAPGTVRPAGDESAIIATAKPAIGSDAAGVMKPAAGDVESAGQAKGAGTVGFDAPGTAKLPGDESAIIATTKPAIGSDAAGVMKPAAGDVEGAGRAKGAGAIGFDAPGTVRPAGDECAIIATAKPAIGSDAAGVMKPAAGDVEGAGRAKPAGDESATIATAKQASGSDAAGVLKSATADMENAGRGKGAGTTGDDIAGTAKLPGDESAIIATAKPATGSDTAGVMKPAAGDVENAGRAKGAGAIGFDAPGTVRPAGDESAIIATAKPAIGSDAAGVMKPAAGDVENAGRAKGAGVIGLDAPGTVKPAGDESAIIATAKPATGSDTAAVMKPAAGDVENAGRAKGAGAIGFDAPGTVRPAGDESAIIATAKPAIGSDAAGVMKPAAGDVENAGRAKGAGAIGFDAPGTVRPAGDESAIIATAKPAIGSDAAGVMKPAAGDVENAGRAKGAGAIGFDAPGTVKPAGDAAGVLKPATANMENPGRAKGAGTTGDDSAGTVKPPDQNVTIAAAKPAIGSDAAGVLKTATADMENRGRAKGTGTTDDDNTGTIKRTDQSVTIAAAKPAIGSDAAGVLKSATADMENPGRAKGTGTTGDGNTGTIKRPDQSAITAGAMKPAAGDVESAGRAKGTGISGFESSGAAKPSLVKVRASAELEGPITRKPGLEGNGALEKSLPSNNSASAERLAPHEAYTGRGKGPDTSRVEGAGPATFVERETRPIAKPANLDAATLVPPADYQNPERPKWAISEGAQCTMLMSGENRAKAEDAQRLPLQSESSIGEIKIGSNPHRPKLSTAEESDHTYRTRSLSYPVSGSSTEQSGLVAFMQTSIRSFLELSSGRTVLPLGGLSSAGQSHSRSLVYSGVETPTSQRSLVGANVYNGIQSVAGNTHLLSSRSPTTSMLSDTPSNHVRSSEVSGVRAEIGLRTPGSISANRPDLRPYDNRCHVEPQVRPTRMPAFASGYGDAKVGLPAKFIPPGSSDRRYMLSELGLAIVLAAGGIRRVLPSDRNGKQTDNSSKPGNKPVKSSTSTSIKAERIQHSDSHDSFKLKMFEGLRLKHVGEDRLLLDPVRAKTFLRDVARGARAALKDTPALAFADGPADSGVLPGVGGFSPLDAVKEYNRGVSVDIQNEEHPRTSTVFRRPFKLISEGETLVSIADELFNDSNVAWLIADLNAENAKEHWIDGKRIMEFNSRQQLWLPVWEDIVEFYSRRSPEMDPDRLITIVTRTKLDKDIIDSALGKVMGTSLPGGASIRPSGAN